MNFAESNKLDSGKMKYLNLKKNIIGGTNHSESELLDAIRTANVLKVNQMIADGVNITNSIIRTVKDNILILREGPENFYDDYHPNVINRNLGTFYNYFYYPFYYFPLDGRESNLTQTAKYFSKKYSIFQIFEKLYSKYKSMKKVFSHTDPTINKVKQELQQLELLEDPNQEQKNRIEELEKQIKILNLQRQVKNVKNLRKKIATRVFSPDLIKFFEEPSTDELFNKMKAQYLEYKLEYNRLLLLEAVVSVKVDKVNQMIADGVNITASIISFAIDNLSRCIEDSSKSLNDGPEQIGHRNPNYNGRMSARPPERMKGANSCSKQYSIFQIFEKLYSKYKSMKKSFSHKPLEIDHMKVIQELQGLQGLEEGNDAIVNRIKELEKQKKSLDLQMQVKNVKSLFPKITRRVFSQEVIDFFEADGTEELFQSVKAQYLEYKPQYDEMVENWEKEHPDQREQEKNLDVDSDEESDGPPPDWDMSPPPVPPVMFEPIDYSKPDLEFYIWERTFN